MEPDQALVDELLAANILADRVAIARDPMRESMALDRLIGRINSTPEKALQALVETAAELTGAGSAGVSLLEGGRFVWRAIAGAWARHIGEGMPFDASPCGVVVARDASLLFSDPRIRFPQMQSEPLVQEALLVPVRFLDRPIGTLWVLSHDRHRFDTEDVRILERLALFATAIEQMSRSRAENAEASANAGVRIRETIAMIRSVSRGISKGAGYSASSEELARFGARISAFADAVSHNLPDISGDLWLLIASTLSRHGERAGDRVILEGPEVAISAEQAGMLGLAFHELLDNAFRFGALSTAAGKVNVRWRVERDDNEPWLHLTWDERGSGRVAAVKRQPGFGFELLTIGLPEALEANTTFDLRPPGLHFALRMPVATARTPEA